MNKLVIGPAPHIRSSNSTAKIMLHMIIATFPVMIASIIIFGPRSLVLIASCVSACVFFEYIFRLAFKKKQTIKDLSAIVTGIILAFNLPVTLPIYMAVIASFAAIVVVKQMFGGIGQNFANPAIVGRIVLMISFPTQMSNYVVPFYFKDAPDVLTGATPLAIESAELMPSISDLFFGLHGGSLGETCSFALLLGFGYLLIMRIVRPVTPIAFMGTVVAGTLLSGGDVRIALLTGGVLLGAIFMATDYSTNPMTPTGKFIFGMGCGAITIIIRQFGSMPEGVAFSILTMNLLTPTIDKFTRPIPFGMKKIKKDGKNINEKTS